MRRVAKYLQYDKDAAGKVQGFEGSIIVLCQHTDVTKLENSASPFKARRKIVLWSGNSSAGFGSARLYIGTKMIARCSMQLSLERLSSQSTALRLVGQSRSGRRCRARSVNLQVLREVLAQVEQAWTRNPHI